MAPTISAMMALPGMPKVSNGMKLVCAPGIVGGFRRRNAFDGAPADCAELRDTFFSESVSGEGRQRRRRRPASTPRMEPSAVPRSIAGMHWRISAQLGHISLSLTASRLRSCTLPQRHREFGDAEHADGNGHETDAVSQIGQVHGHARRAAVDGSMPTSPSSSPTSTMAIAFSGAPCASTTEPVRGRAPSG